MGWEFPWYTLRDDFDADHDVAEWHGTNVFLRDGDEVYRTYCRPRPTTGAAGTTRTTTHSDVLAGYVRATVAPAPLKPSVAGAGAEPVFGSQSG